MVQNECFVGIDTSNYTTSASVVTSDGRVLLNYKSLLPVKEGERGLRQSDAVYAHVKNQPSAMAALSRVITEYGLVPVAVGFSASPTNSADSFMPCFMCGRAFADTFAAGHNIPVYSYSHQEGHIAAAAFSATADLELLTKKLIAFHVSGGTTDVVICTPDKFRFNTQRIGGSNDLHAGQLIDRVAVMMGLQFPGGPEIERSAACAVGFNEKINVSVSGFNCNLSGGENVARSVYEKSGKEHAAFYVLSYIATTLDKLSSNLRNAFPDLPILYSGGVMSNTYIKNILAKRESTYFAEPQFSADNAAGIALLTRERYLSLGR